jgi:hypothetical protein
MAPLWAEAENNPLYSLLHTRYTSGHSNVFWNFLEIADIMNRLAPRFGIERREYTMTGVQSRVHELETEIGPTAQVERSDPLARLPALHQSLLSEEAAQTLNLLKVNKRVDQQYIGGGFDELPSGCTEPYEYPGGLLPPCAPQTLSMRPAQEPSETAGRRPFWDTQPFPAPDYGSGEPLDDLLLNNWGSQRRHVESRN